MNPVIQLKQTSPVFFVTLLLACLGLLRVAQAVVPPPDGGYPGGQQGDPLAEASPLPLQKEVDPTRSLCFGLIAEEVAKVSPELVTPDREGKPQTVRYEAINAMLLNEFLIEHRKVEQQELRMQEQEATIACQQ